MSQFSQEVVDLVESASQLKRIADHNYTKGQYQKAIETYSLTLDALKVLRGSSIGEFIAIKVLANQANAYLKTNEFESAIDATLLALTVPSLVHDIHMSAKLRHRLALALAATDRLPDALDTVDRAISLGETSMLPQLDELREEFIKAITAVTIHPIRPRPVPFTPAEIGATISTMFECKGDLGIILPILTSMANSHGNFDLHDPRGNNFMWATCQMTIMCDGKNPDRLCPILEFLLNHGCMAEQRFGSISPSTTGDIVQIVPGRTPLQMCALAGAVQCARLLLHRGASVATYDSDGWTPLLVACSVSGPKSGNNSEMVQILVDARSRVNHTNREGYSPLAAAAQSNDVQAVKILLESGAKITHRCKNGFSAVIWAFIGSESSSLGTSEDDVDLLSQQSTVAARHAVHLPVLTRTPMCVFELLEYAERIETIDEDSTSVLTGMIEDMKTYNFSKFILILRQAKSRVIEQFCKEKELSSLKDADTIELNNAVDNQLLEVIQSIMRKRKTVPAGGSASSEGTDAKTEYGDSESVWGSDDYREQLKENISKLHPYILTKVWRPAYSEDRKLSPESALKSADQKDRDMILTLMTAVFGPLVERPLMTLRRVLPGNIVGTKVIIPSETTDQPLEPLPADEQMAWCCSLFDDVEELIYAPLSRKIAKRSSLVTI